MEGTETTDAAQEASKDLRAVFAAMKLIKAIDQIEIKEHMTISVSELDDEIWQAVSDDQCNAALDYTPQPHKAALSAVLKYLQCKGLKYED